MGIRIDKAWLEVILVADATKPNMQGSYWHPCSKPKPLECLF
jgi:hypothetical protein